MAQPLPAPSTDDAARLDELLADLVDQRAGIAPISAAERAARRARLGTLLAERCLDALLVEPGGTLRYLADVDWHHSERLFGLVVFADGTHLWIAPAFEKTRAELFTAACPGELLLWDEHTYAFAPLASVLRARGAERIAMDPDVRTRFAFGLAAALGSDAVSGAGVVAALRGTKDEHELALLARANELTQHAIRTVARSIEPGVTAAEVAMRIDHAHRRLGFTNPWNLSLVGPSAAFPHGDGKPAVIAKGDVLLIDSGGSFHGYQSDNTRTWTVGAPPHERFERAWHAVRDAQRAAFETLRPGALCGDVDRAARARLEAAGFGGGYTALSHRLGHGIGVEGHEPPYLDGGSEVVLAPGMTFSNEPGIYLDGEFGLRIEDIVAVTAGGADHFGTWQAGPASPD
ncbi:MAG: aminopeptidase P family protein [bacterium]|nr:aminopeptidase P family protein [bacterium]